MARNNVTTTLDPRRAAAATRLRRLKSAIVGLTAAVALGIWTSVGAAAAPEANVTPTPAPVTITAPANQGFFGSDSPQLGTSTDPAPVLRSQGS
jgi:hypothetical protein